MVSEVEVPFGLVFQISVVLLPANFQLRVQVAQNLLDVLLLSLLLPLQTVLLVGCHCFARVVQLPREQFFQKAGLDIGWPLFLSSLHGLHLFVLMRQNYAFTQFRLKIVEVGVPVDDVGEDLADGVGERGGGHQKLSDLFFVVLVLLALDGVVDNG